MVSLCDYSYCEAKKNQNHKKQTDKPVEEKKDEDNSASFAQQKKEEKSANIWKSAPKVEIQQFHQRSA